MHEPLHVKNKEIMREERGAKPSIKVGVPGGSWSFTGCFLKLSCHQNAFLMHGKLYFFNWQLTVSAPLEEWKCGPMYLCTYGPMDLCTCGLAHLNRVQNFKILLSVKIGILTFGFCSPSSQSYVWMFALEFLYNLNNFSHI